MKIAPKVLHLPGAIQHPNNLISIPSLLLDAPPAAFEELVVVQDSLVVEVVDDPFVEVVAPVGEGVCEGCFFFAVSGCK